MPELGYSVARVHIDLSDGKQHARYSLDVDCGPAWSGGVWYPRQVVYRHTLNEEVQFEQVAEVEAADFGVPIGSETFSYKGLDLPPGRKVLIKPLNRAMIWDGRALKQQAARNP